MTNVEQLNNLIFDTNTNMLMSICCNLIYEPTDPFCQKNASIVMEYFSVHGKMQDLFAWAFTKEYLEKKNVNDDVETYKFFTAFNFLYAIDNMLKGKAVIIPGFSMKLGKFFSRFVSDNFVMRFTYNIQKKKQ